MRRRSQPAGCGGRPPRPLPGNKHCLFLAFFVLTSCADVAKAKPLLPDDGAKKLEALGQAWIDPLVKAGDLSLLALESRLHAGVSLGSNDGSAMGAVIDASYGPMRGNVTCYTDDAGHVVSLGFNTGFVCSETANKQVLELTADEKVTGLAVAYSPKTGKIGHLVFTVTTDVSGITESNLLSKRLFKCGSGGGLPVETLPKGVALAGVDAACLARNATQSGPSRRLRAVGPASSDIDPTSMRVIATKPESTGGMFVAGVVAPSAPRITSINWTATNSTIKVAFEPSAVLGVPGPTLYQLHCGRAGSIRDVAALSSALSGCPPNGTGILSSNASAAVDGTLQITGGMVLGVFYMCRVEARNSLTPEARDRPVPTCSQPVEVETSVPAGAPLNLQVASPLRSRDTSATFVFNAPLYPGAPPVAYYRVNCQTSFNANDCSNSSIAGALLGRSVYDNLTVTVSGLVAGTAYSCWAVSLNDAGLSECSSPVFVTPYALDPPTALGVSGQEFATISYAYPSFRGSPRLTGYKIYCQTSANLADCQNPNAAGVVTGTSIGIELTMMVTGLSLGTPYTCWAVSTLSLAPANALGESACSSPVSVTRSRDPNNNPWMGRIASVLGPKTLSEVVLPGTHDSGTSGIEFAHNGFGRGNDRAARAQSRTIREQLSDGIRYIDLRLRDFVVYSPTSTQCLNERLGADVFCLYHGKMYAKVSEGLIDRALGAIASGLDTAIEETCRYTLKWWCESCYESCRGISPKNILLAKINEYKEYYNDSVVLDDVLTAIRDFVRNPDNAKEVLVLDFGEINVTDLPSSSISSTRINVLFRAVLHYLKPYSLPFNVPPLTAVGPGAKTLQELWNVNQAFGMNRNVVMLARNNSLQSARGGDQCGARYNADGLEWFGVRETSFSNFYIDGGRRLTSQLMDDFDAQLSEASANFQYLRNTGSDPLRMTMFNDYRNAQRDKQLTGLSITTQPSDDWFVDATLGLFFGDWIATVTGYGNSGSYLLNYEDIINRNFNFCGVPGGRSGWLGQRMYAALAGAASGANLQRWNRPNIIIIDNYLAQDLSGQPLNPGLDHTWRAMAWNSTARHWVQTNADGTSFIDFVASLNLVQRVDDPTRDFPSFADFANNQDPNCLLS